MSFVFNKVKNAVEDVGSTVKGAVTVKKDTHAHTTGPDECSDGDSHHLHRFQSFAPQREGNDVKWYVDACGYMYAVSVALEKAQHEIWILDWWLSPELYLRRPPAKNEQYRIDKMLFAAAKRGVVVNIIIYKEVTQALTLSSSHTKHWLEDNDKTGNIKIFRHPDHLPDAQTLASSTWSNITKTGMNVSKIASLPGDALKGIYGMSDDTILYWAHHEKLCVVDGHTAFMGGLDLCFGRWDTNQHSIADAHPGDLDEIVFPGQDYNNARIMDFQDVQHWDNNKLDRKYNSRMGWTDMSISLQGPVVEDLRAHFAQRWNFIYFEKYDYRDDKRYYPLNFQESKVGIIGHPYKAGNGDEPEGEGQYGAFKNRMHEQVEKGRKRLEESHERLKQGANLKEEGHRLAEEGKARLKDELHRGKQGSKLPAHPSAEIKGGMYCQIMRSCTTWSHGVPLEHSIATAYIDTIKNAEHFVYIENQFFITATDEAQAPVENRIGGAIVERVIRAAKHNEKFHMIVAIPAIPGFAGDIKSDDALGTRAIMEFQYNSINRSKGHSIMEKIKAANVDPMEYIRFYNLRNYDRINSSKSMKEAEEKSGVDYDDARRGYDQKYGQAGDSEKYGSGHKNPNKNEEAYAKYQAAAKEVQAEKKGGRGGGQGGRGGRGGQQSRGVREEENEAPESPGRGGRGGKQGRGGRGEENEPPSPQTRGKGRGREDSPEQPARGKGHGRRDSDDRQDAQSRQEVHVQGRQEVHDSQQSQGRQGGGGQGGQKGAEDWDSVASCYMLHGEDIRNVPWDGDAQSEIDAFVSEELYIHTKMCIADDRKVICGSANLNDRSQLGSHDSEIAICIEDQEEVDSFMAGKPWKAAKFAAALRRQIFRKHLGLITPQDPDQPDANFSPVGQANKYDWGSREDKAVEDPLSQSFMQLWKTTAKNNTEVFRRVFHAIPDDTVKNWKQYDEFYEKYFKPQQANAEAKQDKDVKPATWKVGHVVPGEFKGEQGRKELKECLSRVKGTLVEMPLQFLQEEDIAKEGLGLNALTEIVYT